MGERKDMRGTGRKKTEKTLGLYWKRFVRKRSSWKMIIPQKFAVMVSIMCT